MMKDDLSMKLQVRLGYLSTIEFFKSDTKPRLHKPLIENDKFIIRSSYLGNQFAFECKQKFEDSGTLGINRNNSIYTFMCGLEAISKIDIYPSKKLMLFKLLQQLLFGDYFEYSIANIQFNLTKQDEESIISKLDGAIQRAIEPQKWKLQEVEFDVSGRWVDNWFSNMKDATIQYNGMSFKSSENAYQAAKCLNVTDAIDIASMSSHKSKSAINKVEQREYFHFVKLNVMYQILQNKVANNIEFKEKLLSTGNDDIVEFNNWNDMFWGADHKTGRGSNFLGLILMKIRKELMENA